MSSAWPSSNNCLRLESREQRHSIKLYELHLKLIMQKGIMDFTRSASIRALLGAPTPTATSFTPAESNLAFDSLRVEASSQLYNNYKMPSHKKRSSNTDKTHSILTGLESRNYQQGQPKCRKRATTAIPWNTKETTSYTQKNNIPFQNQSCHSS